MTDGFRLLEDSPPGVRTGQAGAVCDRPLLHLDEIGFVRDGVTILDGVSLRVAPGQRWLVLGPNGCGKTSLLRIAALTDHPTSGRVEVLGQQLGRVDIRELRPQLGFVSAALADRLRGGLTAHDVVRTARYGALEPWWHRYSPADDDQADRCLDRLGVGHLRHRLFATLSSGERTRVLLARALMNDPAVLLLDEPATGLDVAGREQLIGALDDLASDEAGPPSVMVAHHLEDVPPSTTHGLLMPSGRTLASGPIDEVLTADALASCFGLPLALERRPDGRFTAWATRPVP